MKSFIPLAAIWAASPCLEAKMMLMVANPNSFHETNDDGTVTPLLRVLGNAEPDSDVLAYVETIDGYTVERMEGKFVYLEEDTATGDLISSGLQAGKDDPEEHGVKKHARRQRNSLGKDGKGRGGKGFGDDSGIGGGKGKGIQRHLTEEEVNAQHGDRRLVATTGTLKNLMVLFRFKDHTTGTVPTKDDINILMNNNGPHTKCPSGSVKDVFAGSSYGQLQLQSTVAEWVTLPQTQAYYADGSSGGKANEMIRDALNALDATGFDFRPFDTDGNGMIDAIGFLHSGYGAEWDGDKNKIWSHKWALWQLPGGKWVSNDGIGVYDYHVSPSLWGTSGSEIGRIGVIAHETGHFLGILDLYDSDGGGSGIGSYGLMANSWGFDGSQYYPPYMCAWSKSTLGWSIPTVITQSGTYTVPRACDNNKIFKIDRGFPAGEYLLIENRQPCGYDQKIPGGGLAIFHIDDKAPYSTEGYPGQTGWPGNGKHYKIALLQADGGYDLERGLDRGDSTDLFHANGVKAITPQGTSKGATYPNTKAYQGGQIIDTQISITEITASSDNMTFQVTFGGVSPVPAPTPQATNDFTLDIKTDKYPGETSWVLKRDSTVVVASRSAGFYKNKGTWYKETLRLLNGNYSFEIFDSYGDGICCSQGIGSYNFYVGGQLRKSGGSFAKSEMTTFTVGTVRSLRF